MSLRLPRAYDKSQKVYKFEKSLYGLNQSPRNWFKKLGSALRNLGFDDLSAAHCVFVKVGGSSFVVLLF